MVPFVLIQTIDEEAILLMEVWAFNSSKEEERLLRLQADVM
jgi:hypothetical protein